MKYFACLRFSRFPLFCLITALLLSTTSLATAGSREDAVFAASKLHQSGAARYLPDEMASLDAALEVAEQLNNSKNIANANKFYLLTLQKARVIESALFVPQTPQPAISDVENQSSDQSKTPDTISSSLIESDSGIISDDTLSSKLIGGTGIYTVVSGDTIRLVAAKLGVSRQHLVKSNKLDSKVTLRVGQKLAYNNRKIIPQRLREGIIVNIPDRTLYFFQQGNLVKSLPVALGVSTKKDKYMWQTPVGKFKVTAKQKDPTWHVPPSIQSEMEELGKEVITSVPPGPGNPLGKFAIKTSIPGILIHSTTKPWSIYSFASHGCIRVYPAQMEDFFNEVRVNTRGEIIYKPVKLAVTEIGRIFLEVHNDIYNKSTDLAGDARKMVERLKLEERIDWKKFDTVVKQKSGVAEDISM